jgi:putative ABC transport system permease protein
MFKNYFKTGWRNLIKNKGYSAINIGGLAVGMTVAILIGLWMYDELSYNKYHTNYNSIAQVMRKSTFNGESQASRAVPRPLEAVMREKYGRNFKNIVMSRWSGGYILTAGEKMLSKTGRYMQPGVMEMLSLRMRRGDWKALENPSSIILSESTAKAFFGDTDAIDKSIRINNNTDVKVTGVFEDLPPNTEFGNLEFICPWDLAVSNTPWIQEAKDQWSNQSFLMYVQLQPNVTIDAASAIIKNAELDNNERSKKFNPQILLHPMRDWHLYSEFKNGVKAGGRIQYVRLFGIIGVFVLLLACINFMNLSTARSEKRAKEVGIRKAIGSMRLQLIRQFLSESMFVAIIAFVLAILLATIALPWFNDLAGKKMTMPWSNLLFWLISLAFVIITGLISGSYPAFYLSSFNPVKVLKGTFRAGRFAGAPRKVLVVVQYTVSVALIIGTIIVYKQINHAKDRPVGYNRQGLLMIHIKSDDLRNKFEMLQDELKQQGVITAAARSSNPITSVWDQDDNIEWTGKGPDKEDAFAIIRTTNDYGKTVGWEIKEGRDFSREFKTDSVGANSDKSIPRSMIINEASAKYIGIKNIVGETLWYGGFQFRVIGVVKDIVMESPFTPVQQAVYTLNSDDANSYVNLRINPTISMGEAIQKIEKTFKRLVPSVPFEYQFADTEYALKFIAEERVGKLAAVFATLAILISCLGLFGLASFMAEKRTKELGVRKVLGASVYNLWKMLSKDFIILVMISCLIAAPIAWYYLHDWLQSYEYRTVISWWVFVVAIAGALVITALTVSYQAMKAAVGNPVKALRTE